MAGRDDFTITNKPGDGGNFYTAGTPDWTSVVGVSNSAGMVTGSVTTITSDDCVLPWVTDSASTLSYGHWCNCNLHCNVPQRTTEDDIKDLKKLIKWARKKGIRLNSVSIGDVDIAIEDLKK